MVVITQNILQIHLGIAGLSAEKDPGEVPLFPSSDDLLPTSGQLTQTAHQPAETWQPDALNILIRSQERKSKKNRR